MRRLATFESLLVHLRSNYTIGVSVSSGSVGRLSF